MQDNNSIGYYIINTDKLIGRYMWAKCDNKTRHRVSPMQIMIMNYLLKNQDMPVFQQDICDTFNLRRSTVSGILTTMEKNDIIVRMMSLDDPRKNEIKLTKTFITNTKKIQNDINSLETVLVKNFTASEKSELIRLLQKLAGNLIEEERNKNV